MSQKTTDEAPVKRHSSLKSKIRNLSINRRKAAHFEVDNRSSSPMSRKISFGSDSEDVSAPEQIASGNTGLHAVISEDRGRSQARRTEQPAEETELVGSQKSTTMSQAQLASPVLTKPTVVSSAYSMDSPNTLHMDDARTSIHMDMAPSSVLSEASLSRETRTQPANAGGFLSSVLNAASNLGTVLGSSQGKVPRNTSSAEDFLRDSTTAKSPNVPNIQISPAQETTPRKSVASVGLGALSLKDIGIQESSKEAEFTPVNNRTLPNTTSTNDDGNAPDSPGADTSNTSRLRSGSVLTSRSRRRRGSNAMSIAGLGDGQGQKITGFAVASNKRNREFHAMFRSVPEADYLLDGMVLPGTLVCSLTHMARLWMRITKGNPCPWTYVCLREPYLFQFEHLRMGHKCETFLLKENILA